MIYFLLASLVMRLVGFNAAAIWYDEAISRYRANADGLIIGLINDTGGVYWDGFLIPFASGPLWLMRLPALVFSVLSLWIAWKIMDELQFTTGQRATACAAMALLPGLLWTAQDARVYAALSCIFLAGAWFAMRSKALGLAACIGLLGFLHPAGIGLGMVLLMLAMLYMRISKVILAALGCLAWIPPMLPLFLNHGNSSFWLVEITPLISLGQAAFVGTLEPTLSGLAVAILISIAAFKRQASPLSILVLGYAAFLWIYGLIFSPILFYRPLIPLLIPICMLAGIVLYPMKNQWYRFIPLGMAALVLLIAMVGWDPSARGGEVDRLAETIRRGWQDGDRLVYVTGTVALPLDHYLHQPACILEWGDYNLTPYYLEDAFPVCTDLDAPGRYWYVYANEPISHTQKPTGQYVSSSYGGWQFATIDVIMVVK